jgi:glyoxylate reductase
MAGGNNEMKSHKVFVTRQIARSALNTLQAQTDCEVWESLDPPPRKVLLDKCIGVHGLLCLLTDPVDAQLLQANRLTLKVVSQMAVGTDNIDLKTATQLGIPVGNTPGVLTEATADHTFALLMAVARRITEADQEVHAGIWRAWGPDVLCGTEVSGATLGIIGLGRIGQAVAKRAMGFGMTVLYFDHQRHPELEKNLGIQYKSMKFVIAGSDFIVLHIYLNPQNYHLFGKEQFDLMKPTAILVNTSRGSVVDTRALETALREYRIAGAGLDVTEPEPIEKNSPLLNYKNVVITPHIASATTQTRLKMANIAVANLLAGLEGKPLPHCVNPEAYESGKQ